MKKLQIIGIIACLISTTGCGAIRSAAKHPARFVTGAASGVIDGPVPIAFEATARDHNNDLAGAPLPYYHKAADVGRVVYWGGMAASILLLPVVAISMAGFSALLGGVYRSEYNWTEWEPKKRGK